MSSVALAVYTRRSMGLFSLTGFTVDVEVITGLILSVVTLNSIFCANLKPASSVIVTMNESWPT